jgi:phosphonopyruvate decarboxylase
MQNSGIGNAVNPLLSLADEDVYSLPILLLIGWRGRPGEHDEPQHVKQGKVTCTLLETMGIPYQVLSGDKDAATAQINACYASLAQKSAPHALVVQKDTFAPYTLQHKAPNLPGTAMTREAAIKAILAALDPRSIIVSTTGMASRELFELREARGEGHRRDFLTVGSMGHASSIALGIANANSRPIVCLDGDGAALMHMGSLATIAVSAPKNLVHIVLNNGAHDSVGGQPTIASAIDLAGVARVVGYKSAVTVSTPAELRAALAHASAVGGPAFIEVQVKKGARSDLGRPTASPQENKHAFMKELS